MSTTPEVATGTDHALFPSSERMMGWIEYLAGLGHRKTGTPQGRASADYIADHFRGLGLDVDIETAPTPCPTVRELALRIDGEEITCFWANATGRQSELGRFRSGATAAEVVYLGRGDEADYVGKDLSGKIVLCDIEFHPAGPSTLIERHPRAEVIDVTGSFDTPRRKYDIYSPNSWPDNYFRAQNAGAAGFVGILVDYMDSQNYNEDYSENGFSFGIDMMTVPAVWVSKADGDVIKARCADAGARGDLVVDVEYALGDALNVIGLLPGQSEDRILVHSHHDAVFAGAVQDASGVSEVMALAEYFSKLPVRARPKTMMFAATDTHFTNYVAHHAFIEARRHDRGKILVDLCIEHIAMEIELDADNRPIATGEIEPRAIYVSDSSGLLDDVRKAVKRRGLDRTILLPVDSTPADPDSPYTFRPDEIISDAFYFAEAGMPVVSLIAGPMYLFHPSDTPDRVAVAELRPVGLAMADIAHAAARRP
jgi:hypothetical protein